MTTQKKYIFKGNWWKYEDNDNKTPGILEIINNKKISLTPDDLFPTKNGVHAIPDRIETILGETLKKKPITLFRCESFGINYNCKMALVGEHYKDFDDIKFKKIKIDYSLLNEWAYPYWIKSLTIENNKSIRNYYKKDNISIKIPEFNLIIDFHFNLRIIGKDPLNKKRVTFITITSKKPTNLTEWWKVIIILRNFIILGLNVPIYPYEFIGITEEQKRVKMYYIAYEYNYNVFEEWNRKGELFTLKNIEDNFSVYLNNWFNKSIKFNRIIANYYSTLNNPDMYNEDKLLHFVSLLEEYHRYNKKNEAMSQEDFKELADKILIDAEKCLDAEQIKFLKENINPFGYEKHLSQRLKELLNENKALIPLNSKEKNNFIKKIKDTRDFWVHKLTYKDNRLLTGKELSKAPCALEMLLIACLLREIGFEDDLLKKLFKRNNKFTYFHANTLSLFKFKS